MAIGFATLTAVAAVVYSHTSQVSDRQVMRAGVERDKERLREKRRPQQQRMQQEQQQ